MAEPYIVVTTINGRYHARCMQEGKVVDEMACELQEDITFICRTLLRWYTKMGGESTYASSARNRLNEENLTPKGKIWYQNQLNEEKEKNRLSKKKY